MNDPTDVPSNLHFWGTRNLQCNPLLPPCPVRKGLFALKNLALFCTHSPLQPDPIEHPTNPGTGVGIWVGIGVGAGKALPFPCRERAPQGPHFWGDPNTTPRSRCCRSRVPEGRMGPVLSLRGVPHLWGDTICPH